MRRTTIFFVFLSLLGLGSLAQAQVLWGPFEKFVSFCGKEKRQESKCIAELHNLLETDAFWGDIPSNFNSGRKAWGKQKLEVDFSAPEGDQGEFSIRGRGKGEKPRISFSKHSDPFELMITLNHEMVHFANSEQLRAVRGNNKKMRDCLTPLELNQLNNERLAFLAEIYFWRSAPDWFKNEMRRPHFNSKLLGKEDLTYKAYYELLDREMAADKNFIAKRYIAMGKYPKCAADLIL